MKVYVVEMLDVVGTKIKRIFKSHKKAAAYKKNLETVGIQSWLDEWEVEE